MIDFLRLLSQKVPPGFSFSFHLGVIGIKIHVKHDKSQVGYTVPVKIHDLGSIDSFKAELIDELVLIQTINKIKRHPFYDRPKKH